jgi:hypothetical protein
LELVRVLKPPVKDDIDDAGKDLTPVALAPAWLLRPAGVGAGGAAAARMAALGAASVDGLTTAQRGLLGVVLCLLVLEPAKAMREDRLWKTLENLDADRFALGESKAGAWPAARAP